ncbi:hypothetical protein AURDEDRAFT_117619 [Auricularia subglabra TFB-10046 SS5]|uniref:Uncharacterized protein n=1 Tax=Auricularia subglabra (strain TFB-10046 / SS5) TaxID=717982 RepID=J0CVR6_AURST|nr:hypothetical protein AURDEDRAFT_117619 [Auricularia subglabra TFB-10046 SS5]
MRDVPVLRQHPSPRTRMRHAHDMRDPPFRRLPCDATHVCRMRTIQQRTTQLADEGSQVEH